jgi:hypothetical protein
LQQTSARAFSLGSIFAEGFALMRERAWLYAVLAVVCGAVESVVYTRTDIVALLEDAAAGKPLGIIVHPPLGLVLGMSLVAQFAIIPSAVSRIVPAFRLTLAGALLMILTLVLVGCVTDVGYLFAVIPGIAFAVLLSQVLVGVLVRLRRGMSLREIGGVFARAVNGSFAMTKGHFGSTLGILILSLAILVVPFCFIAFWVIVLGENVPASLVGTAPALFAIFVYLECSRYALVVRWYLRLASETEAQGTQPA